MNAIIPFAPKAVAAKSTNGLAAAILANAPVSGFPVVSIMGKVFHTIRGTERVLVTKPGEQDPASSLEVVIVGANPHRSRVYYKEGYEEGSKTKPDCYSNNGKSPEPNAANPQSKNCATCVHAQFGSKVDPKTGKKGFACANSQRLAISPVGQINDPMLLRIPGASLKTFTEFVKEVYRAGYDLNEIVTRIGFDYSVAYPAVTFKAAGVLPENMVAEAREQGSSELVGMIVGTVAMPFEDETAEEEYSAAVEALPKREPKPAPKSEPAQEAEAEMETVLTRAAAKKKPEIKVEEEEKPAPKKPAVATVEDMGDDLDALLDGTDFDD